MRLIDAHKLLNQIDETPDDDPLRLLIAREKIAHIILNAPTVKLNLTPGGAWITDKIAFYKVCPFCKAATDADDRNIFYMEGASNFCPNCGADLRGGDR